ncbi:hypothetical protein ABK040_013421 [Willaertia magna]
MDDLQTIDDLDFDYDDDDDFDANDEYSNHSDDHENIEEYEEDEPVKDVKSVYKKEVNPHEEEDFDPMLFGGMGNPSSIAHEDTSNKYEKKNEPEENEEKEYDLATIDDLQFSDDEEEIVKDVPKDEESDSSVDLDEDTKKVENNNEEEIKEESEEEYDMEDFSDDFENTTSTEQSNMPNIFRNTISTVPSTQPPLTTILSPQNNNMYFVKTLPASFELSELRKDQTKKENNTELKNEPEANFDSNVVKEIDISKNETDVNFVQEKIISNKETEKPTEEKGRNDGAMVQSALTSKPTLINSENMETKETTEKVYMSLKEKENQKVKEIGNGYTKNRDFKEENIFEERKREIISRTKYNSPKEESLVDEEKLKARHPILKQHIMESNISTALYKNTKKQVDLRDDKILTLVLTLLYKNGMAPRNDYRKPRYTGLSEKKSKECDNATDTPALRKKSTKSYISSPTIEKEFSEKNNLEVLETYLIEFMYKNRSRIKSNLLFIILCDLIHILNSIAIYFYYEITLNKNVEIPTFVFKGPQVLGLDIFEEFMSCFPFVRITTHRYTLEHWITLSHIHEIISICSSIVKSRFWNIDTRPNFDISHIKLDTNLNVFELHLPKQKNTVDQYKAMQDILETPLCERKYYNKKATEPMAHFVDKIKDAITFEKGRNIFEKYNPLLVDNATEEVISEIFTDEFILTNVRERIAEKINNL